MRGAAIKFHVSPAVQHNSMLTISHVLVSHVSASFSAFLLSQSTLTSFLKRSAPETHDADDGTSNDVHSKKKKSEDNKKKYETKRIRKFQPAWQKEFDWVVYQEETNKMYCSTYGSMLN